MNRSTLGFSIVEGFIVLGVMVLIAGLGYAGWKAFIVSENGAGGSSAVSTRQSAEVITTKADLEAAEKALDDLNFDDESAEEAETQASL